MFGPSLKSFYQLPETLMDHQDGEQRACKRENCYLYRMFDQQCPCKTPEDREGKQKPSATDSQPMIPDEKGFMAEVNAKHFDPKSIQVKVREGFVTVEAKEEESNEEEGTYNFRQLRRQFRLPTNVNLDSVQCEMTTDGLLTIRAALVQLPQKNERVIKVQNPKSDQPGEEANTIKETVPEEKKQLKPKNENVEARTTEETILE